MRVVCLGQRETRRRRRRRRVCAAAGGWSERENWQALRGAHICPTSVYTRTLEYSVYVYTRNRDFHKLAAGRKTLRYCGIRNLAYIYIIRIRARIQRERERERPSERFYTRVMNCQQIMRAEWKIRSLNALCTFLKAPAHRTAALRVAPG